jgi:hypothetical protein
MFAIRNLSVLAYANGFTLWHYKTGTDVLAAVKEPAYFGDASDMLTAGDMVMLSSKDGAGLFVVGPIHDNNVIIASVVE